MLLGFFLGEFMRVTCNECGNKAVITKTNRMSLDAVDLYCSCRVCGHRFVWGAGFKHSLSNSKEEKKAIISTLLDSFSLGEKRDLLRSVLEIDG